MGKRRIEIMPGPDTLAQLAGQIIADTVTEAIGARGRACLALSGGSTPLLTYRMMAEALGDLVPFIHVFQVDERYVPADHPASNYRMLNEALLQPLGLPKDHVHRVPTEAETPQSAAELYEEDIMAYFSLSAGRFPSFDLVLLGLGADGHTASLFPGSPVLQERRRIAAAAYHKAQKMWRITLTLPVLNAARNVMFLVTGGEKSEAVRRVLSGDETLPGSLVRPESGRLLWLLDSAAAGLEGVAGGGRGNPPPAGS